MLEGFKLAGSAVVSIKHSRPQSHYAHQVLLNLEKGTTYDKNEIFIQQAKSYLSEKAIAYSPLPDTLVSHHT